MKKLLFVCTGNTCRSAMAEGICRAMARQRGLEIETASCGVSAFAGEPAADEALEAASEYGADIAAHRSRPLQSYLVDEADAVFCMTQGHLERVRALCPEAQGKLRLMGETDIMDPWGGDAREYRSSAGVIAHALRRILDGLAEENI